MTITANLGTRISGSSSYHVVSATVGESVSTELMYSTVIQYIHAVHSQVCAVNGVHQCAALFTTPADTVYIKTMLSYTRVPSDEFPRSGGRATTRRAGLPGIPTCWQVPPPS